VKTTNCPTSGTVTPRSLESNNSSGARKLTAVTITVSAATDGTSGQ